jgi:hypothetical protein
MTNQLRKCSAATTRPDDGHLSSVLQVALSGLAWVLAVAWLDFSGGLKMHLAPAAMTGVLVVGLTLLLLGVSGQLQRARSPQPCDRRTG